MDKLDPNEQIFIAGSSDALSEASKLIDTLVTEPNKGTLYQRFCRLLPIHYHIDIAQRACTILSIITGLLWGVTFILLIFSIFNFYIFEGTEVYSTSHDARIESLGKPTKIGDFE